MAGLSPQKPEHLMKKVSPYWLLILLATMCFTLATLFVPRAANWNGQSQSDNVFKLLLGEGRKLFANQLFIMGDVYFHSGYYPSIFDRQEQDRDVAAPAHGQADDSDSTSDDFLGPPPDWIAALDRNFVPNRHTHLSAGGASGNVKATGVQEILPWLKLAADMNPQMIETYTVAAYWLRTDLHNPKEAQAFLLEGLHNNPGNGQLMFDLGRLYNEGYHDPNRARNVWTAALRNWEAQSADFKTNTENQLVCDEISMNLARLEESAGNLPQAVNYLEIARQVSPEPDAIQQQIDEAKKKLAAQSSATNAPLH
jgi:tetratricopeptide (TPR) repeat protein